MLLKVALATDDGKFFSVKHFGDASFFDLYEIGNDTSKFLKRITNFSEEEKRHADPKKAESIASILLNEEINVTGTKVYGANLKRMQKKFVCIAFNTLSISEAIFLIQTNHSLIIEELNKGKDRKHLKLEGE